MIKNKILAILLIGVILLAACKQDTTPANLTATLSELVGKVEIKSANSDAFTPADANTVLEPNGQIQTGDDGRVRLDLSSGTIIRVASSSSFTLTSNEETEGGLITKLTLEAGKVFIILNGGHAEVETPSGVASVRGSYMKVEVDPETGDVYVTCLEGHCGAQNPVGNVEFTQGQRTILFHKDENGNWQVPGVEPMTEEDFQEWLDNNPEAKDLFDQAMGTATAMAATEAPTEVPTDVPTPEPTTAPSQSGGGSSSACKTIAPPAGSSLEFQGKVKFEWEPQPNAKKYVVTFITSNGNTVSFETTETSIEKYIEIFPSEGDYQWNVTAYGENDDQLCKSDTVGFSKPDSNYVPPAPPQEKDNPSCDPDPETCGEVLPCCNSY